jgi:hypothetical protein
MTGHKQITNGTPRTKTSRTKRYYAIAQAFVEAHPVLVSIVVSTLYLVLFQRKFLLRGDVWAETHAEYLTRAVVDHYTEAFHAGWAGYIEIIPATLAKAYKLMQFPLGYIDYYYKAIVIIFTLTCVGLASIKAIRPLFRYVWLQIAFCLAMLLALRDVSAFSFINIWYLGFVPIMLVSMSGSKLTTRQQLFYTPFTILVTLTKPSQILLPFIVYKLVKTRQFMSDGLILVAVLAQTYVMVFLDPRHTAQNTTKDLVLIVKAILITGGTEVLKFIKLPPHNLIIIVLANILLVALAILIYRRLGLFVAGLIILGYAYAVYGYALPVDAPVYSDIHRYLDIYYFNYKTQRETLIEVFILLAAILSLGSMSAITRWQSIKKYTSGKTVHATTVVIVLMLLIRVYIPVEVESAGVAAHIDSFRDDLSAGRSVCAPIPPTPAYFPHANWLYESNTICHARNFDLTPELSRMNNSLATAYSFAIPNDTPFELKTVYFIIRNSSPQTQGSLQLVDKQSGMKFYATVPARDKEAISFIPINVSGLPLRTVYEFELTGKGAPLYWGTFQENNKELYYAYFGETRQQLLLK